MELDQELETFKRELPRLLEEVKRWGGGRQYALVKGNEVDSTWDTQPDALRAGYRFFGDESFLVKKIEEEETPLVCLQILVAPCHS